MKFKTILLCAWAVLFVFVGCTQAEILPPPIPRDTKEQSSLEGSSSGIEPPASAEVSSSSSAGTVYHKPFPLYGSEVGEGVWFIDNDHVLINGNFQLEGHEVADTYSTVSLSEKKVIDYKFIESEEKVFCTQFWGGEKLFIFNGLTLEIRTPDLEILKTIPVTEDMVNSRSYAFSRSGEHFAYILPGNILEIYNLETEQVTFNSSEDPLLNSWTIIRANFIDERYLYISGNPNPSEYGHIYDRSEYFIIDTLSEHSVVTVEYRGLAKKSEMYTSHSMLIWGPLPAMDEDRDTMQSINIRHINGEEPTVYALNPPAEFEGEHYHCSVVVSNTSSYIAYLRWDDMQTAKIVVLDENLQECRRVEIEFPDAFEREFGIVYFTHMQISPDGSKIIATDQGNELYVFDLEKAEGYSITFVE